MGELKPNSARLGMNLDSIIGEVKPGQLTYALNAQIASFDGNQVTYQNEQANEFCFTIPSGYKVIGSHNIVEKNIVIYFLANPTTGQSEIGKVVNDSCVYQTVINANCLNFDIRFPIHKAVHKITSCTTEVYWPESNNRFRFIDLDNLPYKQVVQGTNTDPCNVVTTPEVDCNKLNVQPDFSIPNIAYGTIGNEGTIVAGTVQFAIQYCNALGDPYTSYYSVTNPLPIYDYFKVTQDFNYEVGKSVELKITDIDTTGVFDYFNIAVIKTINNITSVELVGTFQIQGKSQTVLYTGQSKNGVNITIDNIFEKFAVYDTAGDVTVVRDVLVWDDLTSAERITYQDIASKITPQWVSWQIPPTRKGYKDEKNAANVRGYMRDEVYAFDMVVVRKNGYQSDRFPLVGRIAIPSDLTPVNNLDSQFGDTVCSAPEVRPRWQVYNTATIMGIDPAFDPADPCYEGPYQFGQFSYWESTETYPCNEPVWGDLQGKPIRHFKFPDSSVTHHHDSAGNIFPLGIRIDMQQVYNLINSSSLTQQQKDSIAEIKIVRANRANGKSVIAKGLLFNVGKYTSRGSTYFYPNYPYNDLRPDPFISNSTPGSAQAQLFSSFTEVGNFQTTETTIYEGTIEGNTLITDGDIVQAVYNGKFGGATSKKRIRLYFDAQIIYDSSIVTADSTNSWVLTSSIKRTNSSRIDVTSKFQIFGASPQTLTGIGAVTGVDFTINHTLKITAQSIDFPNPFTAASNDIVGTSEEVTYVAAPAPGSSDLLDGFATTDSRKRFTFHSPDTSFFQPALGTILKLESVESGDTRSHFVQVKNHSKYAFPSIESYLTALGVGVVIGFASGTYGVSTNVFNGGAAFTAFTIINDVIFKLLPKKNMAYQFNSVGNYTKPIILPNDTGQKIRQLDIASYILGGMQGVGDTNIVNNYERESSVYLRTTEFLPFPNTIPGVPTDNSRFTLGQVGCQDNLYIRDISSYYGSLKVLNPDQYGQIYSYNAIDTGFQFPIDMTKPFNQQQLEDIFGGDTYINRFAFKRKLPFFLDNRVGFPDEADVFYDELGNVGFPTYWFSTDVKRGDGGAFNVGSLFGVKVNHFDCPNSAFFYDAGKIYLFAYGIVNYFVESTVNTDLRQAFNSREGDYYPHVSGDIPDDWFQEINVPIANDNSYFYNKTYSKQNLENNFSTLPIDFIPNQDCTQQFPNRAIYSDQQQDVINYKKNNWRIYRPASVFDFPLTYGRLTSLEGIQNAAVLARFENKSILYNALLTVDTSNPQAAFIGNSTLFKSSPPIDFVETDLGYAGSQHKFFLKTEYGNISIDAKRGQVFLVGGSQLKDLGDDIAMFLTNNLDFQMKSFFPDYDIDNNFKGVGLHGVYDSLYDRVIFTKLDYLPLNDAILYNKTTDIFSLNGNTIELTDSRYFCNISFTLSYWFKEQAWVSFHSYIPNFYVGAINKFYRNSSDGRVWRHNTVFNKYNNFDGTIQPYVIEYPSSYKFQDEIIQSVKDYTKVNRMTNSQVYIQTNNVFFNKSIVYNDQQCSGIRNLVAKPQNDLKSYLQYPKYNPDSIDILFTKSDNFYNYNGFWDVVKDYSQPIWLTVCESLPTSKQLNTTNLDYGVRSFKKYQIRAKDSRIRHILDNRDDVRMTSQFIATDNQISYK